MAKLIVIAGLPGAGKTTWLEQNHSLFDTYYDDFFATQLKPVNSKCNVDGINNSLQNTRFISLTSDLIAGKTIAVCDVVFCIREHRNSFLASVFSAVPDIDTEFVFFENNPDACKANVKTRGRKDRVEIELSLIDLISSKYEPVQVKEVQAYDS